MNIINFIKPISRMLKYNNVVDVTVLNYKGDKNIICFRKGQDIVSKAFDIANRIGDGNTVTAIRGYNYE